MGHADHQEGSIGAAEAAAAAAKTGLTEAQSQLRDQQLQLQQLAHLQQQLTAAQAQCACLEQQLCEIPGLRCQLAKACDQQAALAEQPMQQVSELQQQISGLQQQLGKANQLVKQADQQSQRITELEEQLEEAEQQKQESLGMVAAGRRQLSLLEPELEHQRQLQAEAAAHVQRLTQELQTSTQHTAELEDACKQQEDISHQMEGLRHHVLCMEASTQEHAELRDQLAAMTDHASGLEATILELQTRSPSRAEGLSDTVPDGPGQCAESSAIGNAPLLSQISELEAELERVRAHAHEQVETAMRRQDDWRQHFKRHSTQLQVAGFYKAVRHGPSKISVPFTVCAALLCRCLYPI